LTIRSGGLTQQNECDEDIVYTRNESSRRCIPQQGVASFNYFPKIYFKEGRVVTYSEYIQNILNTRGRFGCGEAYHERHHIIPRCMDGNDDESNLIDLYAREHYEVHKLLAEENPENEKLLFAWWVMSTKSSKTNERYELTAEEYELSKTALSIAQSKAKKKQFINKENHPMFGKIHSEESKDKMSRAKRGKPSSKKGRPLSEKQRASLAQMRIGSKWSEEQHEKMDGRYANGNSTCCVPVYCPELGESFWGLQEVCDKYGFSKPNLSKCLYGERKHCGRHPVTGEQLTWQRLENN